MKKTTTKKYIELNAMTRYIYLGIGIILILTTISYAANKYLQKQDDSKQQEENLKEVEVMVLDENKKTDESIKSIGIVKADSKIDVVSQVSGNATNINFDLGDTVAQGTILANLYSNNISINYNNALASYNDSLSNFQSVQSSTEQTLYQAELAIESAENSLESAKVAYETAQNNYDNALELQGINSETTIENAISSFYGNISTIHSALDSVNYIIKAEGERQLAGIAPTLAVKNSQSLIDAKESYFEAKEAYEEISTADPNKSNISSYYEKMVTAIKETKEAVFDVITVLDNTISSAEFSETTLNTQKSTFSTLHSNMASIQTSAQSTLSNIKNLGTINDQELDNLYNALQAAKTQYEGAEISYQNAEASYESAKQGVIQQKIAAQMSLNNARSQYQIYKDQYNDLSISSPISGQITGKFISRGAEINPGQKVFEISQTGLVKIEIDLSSKDIEKVNVGQKVKIENKYDGVVANINPSADPISKKIRVEIAYDNSEKELIPELFVDTEILAEDIDKNTLGRFYIPLKAVTINQNESYVYILEDNLVKKMGVEIGNIDGEEIEIISGLKNEDKLIINGNKNIEEGEKVKVL